MKLKISYAMNGAPSETFQFHLNGLIFFEIHAQTIDIKTDEYFLYLIFEGDTVGTFVKSLFDYSDFTTNKKNKTNKK
jgi:hypothetical protein